MRKTRFRVLRQEQSELRSVYPEIIIKIGTAILQIIKYNMETVHVLDGTRSMKIAELV